MENREADGYEPFAYTETETEAIVFCESQGFWTEKHCWSISFMKDKRMAKYKYRRIKRLTVKI
jgi:hypothetical protein